MQLALGFVYPLLAHRIIVGLASTRYRRRCERQNHWHVVDVVQSKSGLPSEARSTLQSLPTQAAFAKLFGCSKTLVQPGSRLSKCL